MRRVAILLRNGREIQCSCANEDAAREWIQTQWRAGDEFICICDEDLNAIRASQRKPRLTARDFVLLREMKVCL